MKEITKRVERKQAFLIKNQIDSTSSQDWTLLKQLRKTEDCKRDLQAVVSTLLSEICELRAELLASTCERKFYERKLYDFEDCEDYDD